MALTYRHVKGSPLTSAEADENILTLDNKADGAATAAAAANTAAGNAQNAANNALSAAADAQLSANGAVSDAYLAQNTADEALEKANEALAASDNIGFTRYMGELVGNPLQAMRAKVAANTYTIEAYNSPVVFSGFANTPDGYVVYRYFFLAGKGTYGVGGLPVLSGYFSAMAPERMLPADVEDGDYTQIIPLNTVPEGGFLAAANAVSRDLSDGSLEYFFTFITDGVVFLVQFIGENGIYGGAGVPFVDEDFTSISDSETPPAIIPPLADVTAAGAETPTPIVIADAGNESKLRVSGGGFTFQKGGKNVSVYFQDPEGDATYIIPVKPDGDKIAFVSDLPDGVSTFQEVLEAGSSASGITTPIVFQTNNGADAKGKVLLGPNGVEISGQAGGVKISGDAGGVEVFGLKRMESFGGGTLAVAANDKGLRYDGTPLSPDGFSIMPKEYVDLHTRILKCDVADGLTLTGTISETLLSSYMIPAGMGTGVLDLAFIAQKVNTGGNVDLKVYLHTAAAIGGTQIGTNLFAASNRTVRFERKFVLKTNLLFGYGFTVPAINDSGVSTANPSTVVYNPAVPHYINITATLANSADTFTQKHFELIFKKSV